MSDDQSTEGQINISDISGGEVNVEGGLFTVTGGVTGQVAGRDQHVETIGGDKVGRDKVTHIHYHGTAPEAETPEIPRQPFEPDMIDIPAGPFIMGDDETGRWAKHALDLPAYQISKYPITNRDYLIYVEKEGVAVSSTTGWELARVGQKPPGDKLDHPVVGLSWDEAVAYCHWLQRETGRLYRLPTEAEWEKAARGPSTLPMVAGQAPEEARAYPWGDTFDATRCNTGRSTTPVTHFPPQSPAGVCDLSGNVWEWTLTMWGRDKDVPDFTYPYPPPPQPDGRHDPPPAGTTYREYRICRGGSFRDKPERLRCSSRARVMADSRNARRGFRVVREVT